MVNCVGVGPYGPFSTPQTTLGPPTVAPVQPALVEAGIDTVRQCVN